MNEIATTIMAQLGTLTGIKNVTGLSNGVQFELPKFSRLNVNAIRILLNGKDLYDLEFGRLQQNVYTKVATAEDVAAEDLRRTFAANTGLETQFDM
jgi:hypothetical protein